MTRLFVSYCYSILGGRGFGNAALDNVQPPRNLSEVEDLELRIAAHLGGKYPSDGVGGVKVMSWLPMPREET